MKIPQATQARGICLDLIEPGDTAQVLRGDLGTIAVEDLAQFASGIGPANCVDWDGSLRPNR